MSQTTTELTERQEAIVDALVAHPNAGPTAVAEYASDKLPPGDDTSASYVRHVREQFSDEIERRRRDTALDDTHPFDDIPTEREPQTIQERPRRGDTEPTISVELTATQAKQILIADGHSNLKTALAESLIDELT